MSERATRERVERIESAAARSLALLEAGRSEEARRLLADLLEGSGAGGSAAADDISDSELEAAFQAAEPELDQMLDADRVAQIALRQAQADELHVEGEGPDWDDADDGTPDGLPPSFATATMAELLERQGDVDGASRIRANLAASAPVVGTQEHLPRPSRQRVITTLERWLENVRGVRA